VIAGDIGNQTSLTWVDETDRFDVVIGSEGLQPSNPRLQIAPRDQYGNSLAGRRFSFKTHVNKTLANGTAVTDTEQAVQISEPELGSDGANYTAEVTSIFPTGIYIVEVEIVRQGKLNIWLPPLTLNATQVPCNASRHHVPSETEAGCVCAVRHPCPAVQR